MREIHTVRAECRRSGGWWAVDSPDVPGLHTQARRLADVPGMVRDAALMLDVRVRRVDCIVMEAGA